MVLLVFANDGNGSAPVLDMNHCVGVFPIKASLEQAEKRLGLERYRSPNFDTSESGVYYNVPASQDDASSEQEFYNLKLCPEHTSVLNHIKDLGFYLKLYRSGVTT